MRFFRISIKSLEYLNSAICKPFDGRAGRQFACRIVQEVHKIQAVILPVGQQIAAIGYMGIFTEGSEYACEERLKRTLACAMNGTGFIEKAFKQAFEFKYSHQSSATRDQR